MTPTDDTPRPPRRAKSSQGGGAAGLYEEALSEGQPSPPPPPPRQPPRPTGGPSRDLQRKLEEFIGSLSLPFAMAGDAHCAEIIAQRGPALAEAWADLAKQNAGVRRVLNRLLEGSAWGGVAMSTLAIGLPIARHHGVYRGPDPFAIFYPPPESQVGRVIVPPPPASPSGAAGAQSPSPTPAEGAAPQFTPPLREDQPPGVVTVAGTSDNHATPPGAA